MDVEVPQPELVDIDRLQLDGDNPNKMKKKQLHALRKAIQRWGFIVPIVTNRDLLVADGEQRITVAKELGMKQVPVVRLDVEDVDRRLLRQVLNKLKGQHVPELDQDEFLRIIEAGDGRPRLIISPQCVNLIEELQLYDASLPKGNQRDHGCDGIRYALASTMLAPEPAFIFG